MVPGTVLSVVDAVMAGPRLTGDRKEGVAFLERIRNEAVHHADGVILDVMAKNEGILVGMDSVHHVLIHDIPVCGVARVAAGDVPVYVGITFGLRLGGELRHNALAVVGADRIGASAGETEQVRSASGLLLDHIQLPLHFCQVPQVLR